MARPRRGSFRVAIPVKKRITKRKELCERLSRLRTASELSAFSDVVIVCDGVKFPCHRCVLASASPVLAKLLSNGFRESNQREVVLKDVDPGCFSLALSFIYSAEIRLCCLDASIMLLDVAQRFHLDPLQDSLQTFARENLSPMEACSLLTFAENRGLLSLRAAAYSKIQEFFAPISRTEQFARLEFSVIEELVRDEHVLIKSELQVLFAILHWLDPKQREIVFQPDCSESKKMTKNRRQCLSDNDGCLLRKMKLRTVYEDEIDVSDASERAEYASRLFQHLRLDKCSENELKLMCRHPQLKQYRDFYEKVLEKVLKYHETGGELFKGNEKKRKDVDQSYEARKEAYSDSSSDDSSSSEESDMSETSSAYSI